ncbi:MAG: BatA domain-containing protein, partial [Pseudomonadota bacterium]
MIGFGIPAVLFALLALPAIYWLLRLTPPRPETEVFPPLAILLRLQKKDETPAKSPWWLTLLRIAMAGFVIVALARPLLNPQVAIATGSGTLLIAIDNDWASGGDWEARIRTAEAMLDQAADSNQPVALIATVASATSTAEVTDAATAAETLRSMTPVAARADRGAAISRLTGALPEDTGNAALVLIGPAFASINDPTIALDDRVGSLVLFANDAPDTTVLTGVENATDGLNVSFVQFGPAAPVTLIASDVQGRPLAETQAVASTQDEPGTATFDIPFELRNDVATIRVSGQPQAGAVYLLDDSNRRRRVALLTGIAGDEAQPLLSPLFYIERALSPFADIIEARTGDLTVDIPEIVNQGVAVIVLADIGVLPNAVRDDLDRWLDAGGTLVRFAGPRLAATTDEDPYLPV